MPELLLIGAVIGGLAGLGALSLLSWELLFGVGLALVALGLLAGVPGGLAYHVALHRVLSPRGSLGPRWWVRPDRYHGHLAGAERRRVMRWFRFGAAGFALTITGCALLLLSVARGD